MVWIQYFGLFMKSKMNQTHPLSELFKELDVINNSSDYSMVRPIRNCRQFILSLGLMFVSNPNIRWAIFGDEEDGVVFVMHSQKSKRQIMLEFALYDNSVNIIQIDKRMKRSECEYCVDQTVQLKNAITWVKH